jgi:hypothetical protein
VGLTRAMSKNSPISTKGKAQSSAGPLALFGPPPILEGEDAAAYDELVTRMIEDVKPRDIIEKILIRDIVDLQWQIIRLRRFGCKLLAAAMTAVLASELRPLLQSGSDEDETSTDSGDYDESSGDSGDCESSAGPGDYDESSAAYELAKELAQDWTRREPRALTEVDRLLASVGRDIDAVMVDAFVSKLDEIQRIEYLITTDEARRNAALRELDRHRSTLAHGLREKIDQIESTEPQVIPPSGNKLVRIRRER